VKLPMRDFFGRTGHRRPPRQTITLEYPVDCKPRWGYETPNPFLYDIIDQRRATYRSHLQTFTRFIDDFVRIDARPGPDAHPSDPCWINGWLPALDSVALYAFLVLNKPAHYVEVGSGNSTKFARRAITDHGLPTQIISIDPNPRAEINDICDRTIREPAERVPVEVFDMLGANDILFIDSSHRVLMNSDVTALFLDVLPRLKPGVIVEIHDVTLPYDYPAAWTGRYYSEQYLLAAYLLARGSLFDIELANTFISVDPELQKVMSPLWARPQLSGVETHGGSFWIRMR
jgi:hypothetical protein